MCLQIRSLILFLSLILNAQSVMAQQEKNCIDSKNEWQKLILNKPTAQSKLKDWATWQNQKNKILDCLAQNVFYDFINSDVKIEYRSFISDANDQENFKSALQKEAIDQTLELFRTSGSPVVLDFRSRIIKKATSSGMGFSMTESGKAIEDLPAGYIRAQGHIVMNYSIMNRNDWLFLFIHEFSHLIDPKLEQAVKEAIDFFKNDPQFVLHMMSSIKNVSSISELPIEDQKKIDQYLRLSLQRGWIAEITAWTTTMEVYKELKDNSKVGSIEWANEMIKNKSHTTTWKSFFSTYLKDRFSYPEDSIYKNDLIRKRSDEIESELLKQ